MRINALLVLVFATAMLFAVGGNAAPPSNQPSTHGDLGDIAHLPVPQAISFTGEVMNVKAGKVFSAGEKDAPSNWLCIALIEVQECKFAEPICGVSTQWVYVTKEVPLEAMALCTMLSQAAVEREEARIDGVCTSVPATQWCELTSLEVSGVPPKTTPGSGFSDQEHTYQPESDSGDSESDEGAGK